MKLKDMILVAAAALLILTWLFPPMSVSEDTYRNRVAPKEFDGFHFILSKDPWSRVRTMEWAKLVMLDLVILGVGGICYFVVSKNTKV